MTTSANAVPTGTSAQPHLKRVLSLWDLIYYGVILTSPIAAVTFGALLAFMGVNLAALSHFWFSPERPAKRGFFVDVFLPGFGITFCFVLLISLQTWTKYAGLAWLVIGILYGAYKTRGFTLSPKLIDFSES